MATTNDPKDGMVLNPGDRLWQVVEFQYVKPGKSPIFIRTKIKGALSGKIVDKTLNASLKAEAVTVDRRDVQYLYKSGDDYVLMDVKFYEQTYVPPATVGEAVTFMLGNQEVVVAFHKDSVLFVELPASVVPMISRIEPGLQGDRSNTDTKPATVGIGVEVQAPLSLNTGDKVKVDTRSGPYVPRVND